MRIQKEIKNEKKVINLLPENIPMHDMSLVRIKELRNDQLNALKGK